MARVEEGREGRRVTFGKRKSDIGCLPSQDQGAQTKMAAGEYLVCFSEKCDKEDVKKHIIECLTLAKLSVTREEFEGKTLLTIGAPFELLAQKVRLELPVGRSDACFVYIMAYLCFSCSFRFANECEVMLKMVLF